jgi:hypothetical protein
VTFINDASESLAKHGVERTVYRGRYKQQKDYYDYFADLMFEAILNGAAVNNRQHVNCNVQYVAIWSQSSRYRSNPTRRIAVFKLRRLHRTSVP